MTHSTRQVDRLNHSKGLFLLTFALLGFAGPFILANSSTSPTPKISPKPSQSVKPTPASSSELKKSEKLTPQKGKDEKKDEKKDELPIAVSAAILLTVICTYGLVYWLRPRWLLLIPSDFKTPKLGVIPELSPSFIHFFQYQPRVLDAWVKERIDRAREEFDERESVKERRTHVSMPVELDEKILEQLTAKDLRKSFSKKEIRVLISGEGGSGKTHLACQIAKWAMSTEPELSLCSVPVLPVLIEEELEEAQDNKSPLLDAITRQLKNLRDEETPIPEPLLKKLLEKRRVLVIVDHLSEMSDTTRKVIRFRNADFPANALVVTSRLPDILGKDVIKTSLKPMRVNGNRLSIFMDSYLKKNGKRDLFEDDRYFDYLRRLSSIVTDSRQITVLFAKLYADQMIAVAEGQIGDELPKNVPDLMMSYINELNRNVAQDKLDDSIVQQDLKLIAWECLQKTFKPETADCHTVLKQLATQFGEEEVAKDKAKQHLKYLEERLFIVRTVKPANQKLRISLDPLAEYLAGLYLVSQHRNDEALWRKFLTAVPEKNGSLEEIQGFLLAARECCLVSEEETQIPSFVAEELGRLAGLDLETLKQEQLNRRIRYLVSDLSRPDTSDRLRAVEALGNIGPRANFAAISIIRYLEDRSLAMCHVVIQALARLENSSEPILKVLLTFIANKNELISDRVEAVYALAALRNSSEPVLKGLLIRLSDKDDDRQMHCSVIQALGKLGNNSESVLNGLLTCLKDKQYQSARWDAIDALGMLGNDSVLVMQELFSCLTETEKEKWDEIEALERELGEEQSALLLQNGPEKMRDMMSANLFASFEKNKLEVTRRVALALIRLGNSSEPIMRKLFTYINNKNDCHSDNLGKIVLNAFREFYIIQLFDPEDAPRHFLQKLATYLNDKNPDTRGAAVQALASLGNFSEPLLQKLRTCLNDENPDVCRHAQDALDKLLKQANRGTKGRHIRDLP